MAAPVGIIHAQTVGSLNESDYTVPTWTKLLAAIKQLQPAQTPYSVNMVFNGDPTSRMAFNWFTNPTTEAGEVQVVEKADATDADFAGAGTSVWLPVTAFFSRLRTLCAKSLSIVSGRSVT